jgi:hypothetical protein
MIWDRGGETATGRRNSGQEQQRAEMCMDIYIYICICIYMRVCMVNGVVISEIRGSWKLL